jgi:hypothetical protein
VRLEGAGAEDAELRGIRPRPGPGDDLPELAPDAATLPFARLVRRLAGVLLDDGDPAAAAVRAQLPTFADGVRLLELADAVDGGQPSAPPSG